MVRKAKNKKIVKTGFPKRTEYMFRWKDDRNKEGWFIGYNSVADVMESMSNLKHTMPKKCRAYQIGKMQITDVTEEEIK